MKEKGKRYWYKASKMPLSSETERLCKCVQSVKTTFSEMLTEEQAAVFRSFCDAQETYRLSLAEDAFCEGFCVGGKLMKQMWEEASQ